MPQRPRKTRREKVSQQFARPMNAQEKQMATLRIEGSARLPKAVKAYLLGLMERRPAASILTINMFCRMIPQIVIGKSISQRRSLQEVLERRKSGAGKTKPITRAEKQRYKAELEKAGFFSRKEVGIIMAEIEKRPALSEIEAHAIVHYFMCNKILDRL